MRDIVVVGSLNADLALRTQTLPRPGETVRAESLQIGPGGKGLNQAVAAARLGARVHLIGRVGDDAFADTPMRALRDAGVDTTHTLALADTATGTAVIAVDARGENQILIVPGANERLSPADIEHALPAFRAASTLLVQLETPLDTVRAALDTARAHGTRTVLDPAPAQDLDDDVLRLVNVLTPNELEAETLSGERVQDVQSAARAGARLRARSGGDVVVTLGAQGCVWVSATGFEHVPAPSVQVVDTTGAGDAFNGGLGVALARGESLASALHFAVRVGSAATTRRGAANAMPRVEDLTAL